MPGELSPVGVVHEHFGEPVTEFGWQDGRAACTRCGIAVEIVMLERRITEFTVIERGVEVQPAHALRHGKVQDESSAAFCSCEKNPPSILVSVDGVDGWVRVQRCEPDPQCYSHGTGAVA